MTRITTLLVAALLVSGCGDESGHLSATGIDIAAGDPLTPEEKGKVLAKVGDEVITLESFEARLNQQSPFARARYNSLERKREFLDSMVRFELLAMEAHRKGYDKHPDVVLARKQAMVKRLMAEEIRGLVKISDITEADARAWYDAHPEDFDKAAEVRAAHIMLDDEATAKAVLAEVQAKIEADPLKARDIFADFAKARSKDPATQRHGGDLQFFGKPGESRVQRGKGQPPVPPALATAAFNLGKVGAVHPVPIKTSFGWHIVQKTGFRRPYKREFDDVKTSIRNKLFRKRKSAAMEDFVQNLKKNAKIEIDDAALAKVEAKRGPAGPRGIAPPMPPGLGNRRRPGAGR